MSVDLRFGAPFCLLKIIRHVLAKRVKTKHPGQKRGEKEHNHVTIMVGSENGQRSTPYATFGSLFQAQGPKGQTQWPSGCQAITLLIQWCRGNVAKHCAKFQWCCKQISDHDLDPVCEVKTRTRSFQMWRGPPLPGEVSDMQHPYCVNHCGIHLRCPAAKNAMGEMRRSKYSSFWAIETFGSQRIRPFALKALAAACSRHSTSHVVLVPVPSSTCIQAACGLIPCQELIWSIHSACAITTVVGPALWGLLSSAHSTVILPRQDFQRICRKVRH